MNIAVNLTSKHEELSPSIELVKQSNSVQRETFYSRCKLLIEVYLFNRRMHEIEKIYSSVHEALTAENVASEAVRRKIELAERIVQKIEKSHPNDEDWPFED